MNFLWKKKKTTNYGKIVAVTVAVVAGVCTVAYVLVKLYEKHIACNLALDDDDDCICELDLGEDCDCDLCKDSDNDIEVETEIAEDCAEDKDDTKADIE